MGLRQTRVLWGMAVSSKETKLTDAKREPSLPPHSILAARKETVSSGQVYHGETYS
jgi:hypothetical protein